MLKEILISQEFANVSTFLSAVGSLGAVIVALYVANKSNRPKVNIHSYNGVIAGIQKIEGYMIFITNKSPNLNLTIQTPLYVRLKKKLFTKEQKGIIFTDNHQLDMTFALPKTLKYGEGHIFCLIGNQIKEVLEKCSQKKITFQISDTIGNVFYHKVDREKLEESLKK